MYVMDKTRRGVNYQKIKSRVAGIFFDNFMTLSLFYPF